MVLFDSTEYWQANRWDRYIELGRVPQAVKTEFLRQEELTVSTIARLAAGDAELRVMDLACGTGKIADSVLRAASPSGRISMTLVDFNSQTLEMARQNLTQYHNVSFLAANAYDIGDVVDGYFDVVICLELLHHVSDLTLLLPQIATVLKPNGLLIGNVLAAASYTEWDRLKYGWIKSRRRQLLCFLSEGVYHKSPDAIRRMIRRLGLARIRPLTREQLLASLEPHFDMLEIVNSYYYWFSAKAAR